nr:protein laz1 [Quercus suber]
MAANLRDTLYGIFEEYKNSTSDICNMIEVASSSGGVHGHYVKGSYFKMVIASIVHLYVFPAKPYELMEDCFTENISVLGDYFADCPFEFDVMFKLYFAQHLITTGNYIIAIVPLPFLGSKSVSCSGGGGCF